MEFCGFFFYKSAAAQASIADQTCCKGCFLRYVPVLLTLCLFFPGHANNKLYAGNVSAVSLLESVAPVSPGVAVLSQ